MGCRYIKTKASRVCIGSMDKQIGLIDRKIEPTSSAYTEDMTDIEYRWASIETRSGIAPFSGVNIDESITHIFRLYLEEGLVANGDFVLYNGEYYRVVTIERINEGSFMALHTTNRGDTDKLATLT